MAASDIQILIAARDSASAQLKQVEDRLKALGAAAKDTGGGGAGRGLDALGKSGISLVAGFGAVSRSLVAIGNMAEEFAAAKTSAEQLDAVVRNLPFSIGDAFRAGEKFALAISGATRAAQELDEFVTREKAFDAMRQSAYDTARALDRQVELAEAGSAIEERRVRNFQQLDDLIEKARRAESEGLVEAGQRIRADAQRLYSAESRKIAELETAEAVEKQAKERERLAKLMQDELEWDRQVRENNARLNEEADRALAERSRKEREANKYAALSVGHSSTLMFQPGTTNPLQVEAARAAAQTAANVEAGNRILDMARAELQEIKSVLKGQQFTVLNIQ